MKVIFNIEPLVYPLTGIGRYTFELARALADHPELDELILWSWLNRVEKLPDLSGLTDTPKSQNSNSNSNLSTTMISNLRRLVVKSPVAVKTICGLKHFLSGFKTNRFPGAIYHGPNFYLPRHSGPKVVTFHDLSILKFPQFHPAARVKSMESIIAAAARQADLIITVSEYARQEIIEYFGLSPQQVRVTREAAADFFVPRDDESLVPHLSQFGLKPRSYCLFVGTIEPRKNIETIINAYQGLPESLRLKFPLVISGHEGWKSEQLHQRLDSLARTGWLINVGYLPGNTLSHLMAGAALFLFPSLYEGFGLPPLEAMQCGVPTIVSNRASLPEVVGDGLPCLEPLDVDLWSQWIRQVLEDPVIAKKMATAALARSAEFSWSRCADQTIEAYRQLEHH